MHSEPSLCFVVCVTAPCKTTFCPWVKLGAIPASACPDALTVILMSAQSSMFTSGPLPGDGFGVARFTGSQTTPAPNDTRAVCAMQDPTKADPVSLTLSPVTAT